MDLSRLPINKDGKYLINDEYVNSEFEKIFENPLQKSN